MFRSVLFTLALVVPCAAQPPSSRDRMLSPTPKFDAAAEYLRSFASLDRMIALTEDLIEKTESTDRLLAERGWMTPAELKSRQAFMNSWRKEVNALKNMKQEMIDARKKGVPYVDPRLEEDMKRYKELKQFLDQNEAEYQARKARRAAAQDKAGDAPLPVAPMPHERGGN
jgi:hypothetical protein